MKRSAVGSVIKAEGGGWFARLRYTDAEGRPREKKRKFETKRQAGNAIADLKDEALAERLGRKTYRELDRFYRRNHLHKARFVGGHKISGFRQDLGCLELYLDRALEHFGDRELHSITYADVAEFKQKLAALPVVRGKGETLTRKPRSMSDINHHLKRVRRLFMVAIENGWLTENPFRRGAALVVESAEVERTRVLSANEETRLLSKCVGRRKHLRPVIIFAIETGMRRGEIQTLKWSSVDLSKRFAKVESHNSKTLKSRLVPLSARAAEVLALAWQNSTKRQNAAVFGSYDFKRAFNGARDDAGLKDVHFHDLRHTAKTRMLEKGISPPLVMKISGHSQMKTFMRYVNQSEASIFDIAERLDRAA